ncbi:outer membrane beta-barrel family protein [Porphyromonas macacae]|uniref:outer membrane beta-barrel family protein n=1 Tax=Porphyromonas macacae TaxID=28115 RepID=UPI0024ACDB72|nr:outer membrane beta-barrel family protein [Porphyromonas macacae]
MKRLILGAFFLLSSVGPVLYAQNSSKNVKLETKAIGHIVESDGSSVPFATVRIKPSLQDSTLSYNQITDNEGMFRIALPRAKSYKLIVSFVGMKTLEKEFSIPEGSSSFSLGKLVLAGESTDLQGITVRKARPLVKMDVDKISYSIKEDPESKTSDLLKMLRKVPLVTVDGQGNIQVNGSSDFKIYLNGKPSKMMDKNAKDVLRSIPANSIKNVEVITDPGVKFDAESGSAILNIVTDSGQGLVGFSGSVHGSVDNNGSVHSGLFLNAKKGKWGLSGNYNLGKQRMPKSEVWSETRTPNLHSINEGTNKMNNYYHFFNATLTFEIDSLNLFSLSGNGLIWGGNSSSESFERTVMNNTIASLYRQKSIADMDGGNLTVNADFQHATSTPGELLTISYRFDHAPNNSEDNLMREQLDPVSGNLLPDKYAEQFSKNEASMNEHTAQVDYTKPLFGARKHTLESGVKYIARRSQSEPLYRIRYSPDGVFVPGSLYGQDKNAGIMNYNQDIYAVYFSVSSKWTGKISTKAGVRLEGGKLSVKYKERSEADFKNSFLDWVPQIRINYNPSLYNQFSLNYNFRIRRPGVTQMNPYRNQQNAYSVRFGNPELEAQRNHNLGLTYNRFSGKFTFNSSVTYLFSNNAIQSYTFTDDKNPQLLQTTYGNLGKSRSVTFSLFGNYTPWAWLRIFAQGNTSYNYLNSVSVKSSDEWWGSMAFLSTQFTMPKQWNLFLVGGFFSNAGFQQKNTSNYFSAMTLSKGLFNEKLNLSLTLSEPFRSKVTYKSGSKGQGFETNSHFTNLSARSIYFSVRYSFGQMKQQIKKVSRGIVNDDLMNGGNKQGVQGGQGGGVPTGR